jgi:hypothetical protein
MTARASSFQRESGRVDRSPPVIAHHAVDGARLPLHGLDRSTPATVADKHSRSAFQVEAGAKGIDRVTRQWNF